MEWPVELPAAISAEESSVVRRPPNRAGKFWHANVSGLVRLVVTEADTTGCALQHISSQAMSR